MHISSLSAIKRFANHHTTEYTNFRTSFSYSNTCCSIKHFVPSVMSSVEHRVRDETLESIKAALKSSHSCNLPYHADAESNDHDTCWSVMSDRPGSCLTQGVDDPLQHLLQGIPQRMLADKASSAAASLLFSAPVVGKLWTRYIKDTEERPEDSSATFQSLVDLKMNEELKGSSTASTRPPTASEELDVGIAWCARNQELVLLVDEHAAQLLIEDPFDPNKVPNPFLVGNPEELWQMQKKVEALTNIVEAKPSESPSFLETGSGRTSSRSLGV